MLQASVGTPPQSTATIVVDTGSGSFYDNTYLPASSTTAKDMKKTGYLGCALPFTFPDTFLPV
jgi:hypothetical protein